MKSPSHTVLEVIVTPQPPSGPSRSRNFLTHAGHVAAVLAAGVLAFSSSFENEELVWDDEQYVLANTWIHELSRENLRSLIIEPWMGNHHPLTMLSLALDYRLSGRDAHGYHVTSLGLHLLNSLLVYLVLCLLVRRPPVALVTALLFVLHPTRVESVAWISARKDLLFLLFYLLGLAAYLGIRNRAVALGLSFLAFVFSAGAKPMAVSFPVVLLVIDWLQRRLDARRLLEKVSFAMVAALLGWLTLRAQEPVILREATLLERLVLSVEAVGFYLEKLAWPHPLSALYPRPRVLTLQDGATLLRCLVAVLVSVIAWLAARKARVIPIALLAFMVTILPVLHFVSFGAQLAADRYTYLPYVPLFALVAAAAASALRSPRASMKAAAALVLGAVALVLGLATHERVRAWHDNRTLFADVLRQYPESHVAHTWLGTIERAEGHTAAAEDHALAALRDEPDYPNALLLLGLLRLGERRYQEASELLERVVALEPRWNHAWTHLGNVYDAVGRRQDSKRAFLEAVAINENAAVARVGLARHAVRERKFDEALAELERALAARPAVWRQVEGSRVFAPLHARPDYRSLIDRAKDRELRERGSSGDAPGAAAHDPGLGPSDG
ncbi:MAG: hypothetical protein AB1486_04695 [Planctomycetota bacterium]